MVDSRAKGARNELAARDKLREYTKLGWERTPSSGALDAKHGLKGDLYIPNCNNKYCVEVKAYKDEHLNSSIITSIDSQLHKWWNQALVQAAKTTPSKLPLLLFKKDRGKWFVVTSEQPSKEYNWVYICKGYIYVALLEDWIAMEEPKWILTV